MSLLSDAMENCIMMDRITVDDGYGGYMPTWHEGVEFDAAIVLDTSVEAKIAEAPGVTGLYTITTKKAMNLQYHDVFKRVSDGKIFRVTSDGDDKKTPNSALLNMRQVSAENRVRPMDKAQAIHKFWSGFGLKAYDESTVPNKSALPEFPYITYSVSIDDIGNVISLSASIWDKSMSWARISKKAEEISKAISEMYPPAILLDRGRLYLTKGTPFAQRMSDPDDTIRRIYINLNAEFLTAY